MKKAAFVTGGSGDIGSAICRRLAAEGYTVCIGYNTNKSSAEKVCEELKTTGADAFTVGCDIRDRKSVQKTVQKCSELTGGIELLVNNAGTAHIGLFTDMSEEELLSVIDTDLIGAMRVTKAFLPEMIREHKGVIINISSVWGEKGASCEVAYSAAKAGLNGFTKALARETAPSGIRVNAVSCGFIDTKMNSQLTDAERSMLLDEIPASRFGRCEDIAELCAFLASEKASYINGQIIRADGCWI
ncbi:MAG: 3-oxoacyl-ACP reductase FabG [Ruminococcus sp.]|nr:3-oxoacyl-ACP reductase FabG [Ruminococcus sp.]